MELFANTIERARKPEHVEALRDHAAALMTGCERALQHPRDRAAVRAAYEAVGRARPSL
jgi:hypothetical protein